MVKYLLALLFCFNVSLGFCKENTIKTVARDFFYDSSEYFLSRISLSYFDHFDKHEKTNNIGVYVPLAMYDFIRFDPYFIFSKSELREFGMQLPITYYKEVTLIPSVFRDFEHDGTGFAITATIKLK